MMNFFKRLWKDEDGIGVLEILLIVAVIVAIAFAFRDWIMKFVEDLFGKANKEGDKINNQDTDIDTGK
jgi:Flp pilus assembly pilin Flp